jgi:hypothetical protein
LTADSPQCCGSADTGQRSKDVSNRDDRNASDCQELDRRMMATVNKMRREEQERRWDEAADPRLDVVA